MPLNSSAKEWQPSNGTLNNIKTGPSLAMKDAPVKPRGADDGHDHDGELDFDEMFERCASAPTSPHSTPRTASLVGPSPLPSPSASPQLQASLLGNFAPASTEHPSTLAAIPETAPIKEIPTPDAAAICPSSEPLPTVTTHVETATSAAAASASGGHRPTPNDFELLRVVGQGAFGKVFQVRKRDTDEVFAMKVMKKSRVIEKQHGEYVKAERDVLTAVLHPYIVTLRYSFQTSSKLYLVLDFINGGHLFFQLYRAGTFDEPLARLYTAELVLAVAHLHSLGFVHRDLKPENVLLDSDGHIRVTDFGLAKSNLNNDDERSNSFVGTMEYMAPEIVSGAGHSKCVDWWSVGILLYEMVCGMPPFRAKSRAALQKMILTGKLKLPTYLSTDSCSLLKGLLQKDASKRLGFGPKGSEEIMKHPFFLGIDWDLLKARKVPSPFKPNIRSYESVENFDKIWTDMPVQDSPCTSPIISPTKGGNSAFDGFTYIAPSILASLNQFSR